MAEIKTAKLYQFIYKNIFLKMYPFLINLLFYVQHAIFRNKFSDEECCPPDKRQHAWQLYACTLKILQDDNDDEISSIINFYYLSHYYCSICI